MPDEIRPHLADTEIGQDEGRQGKHDGDHHPGTLPMPKSITTGTR